MSVTFINKMLLIKARKQGRDADGIKLAIGTKKSAYLIIFRWTFSVLKDRGKFPSLKTVAHILR